MLRSVSLKQLYHTSSSSAPSRESTTKVVKDFYTNLHTDEKKEKILEKMNEFVETIGKIKTKIESDLTLENITEYKSVITSFLNFYVDNVMQYKDVLSRHPRFGYPQKMTIVKQVEDGVKDLEDIMGLINTKTGHLEMLNKIGEIHGLILNLVL